MIESIEAVNDDAVMIIINDEKTAKQVLKKNPRCQVQKHEEGDEERYALIYPSTECNLLNAVKRG